MITFQITEQQKDKLFEMAGLIPALYEILGFSTEKKQVPVTERIKTYEDACKELGREPYDEVRLGELGLTTNDIAYQKLVVVVEALNEGWKPDVCDNDVRRFYPWFRTGGSPSSFAFDFTDCDCEVAYAGSGSRLALKNEELANYCGQQFLELWKEFLL